MVKRISILGSTGSIGTQTLQIVNEFRHQFEVVALTAGSNIMLLKDQIAQFKPQIVGIRNESDRSEIEAFCKTASPQSQVISGMPGLLAAVELDLDIVVVAVVGTTSLLPTVAAINRRIPVALACKEVLVSAGHLVMDLARQLQVPIIPIDSEHAALKQCLAGINEDPSLFGKLILTASGGPFRETPSDRLANVTLKDALNHPKWKMGAKITVDSSTLMNKGLEVIEAHHLFNCPYDQIEVVVHPQSIIHSFVEYTDGSVIAQMGLPDMRFPIQYALTYPDKWQNPWPKVNFAQLGTLTFEAPDLVRFPLLRLAFDAGKSGGCLPAVMNAANEAAVGLFLQEKVSWRDLYPLISEAMDRFAGTPVDTIDQIVALDEQVKAEVTQGRIATR